MTQNILPNFIIAGVNKAGTTSVFQYLNAHPQVCCSRDKETGYFFPIRYGKQPEAIEVYLEQFLDYKNEKIIMEATPGYFYGGKEIAFAIQNAVQKECKVLIILREPVNRMISFYRAKKKNLELDRSVDFKTYVNTCMTMPEKELKMQENNKYTGVWCGYYINYIADWYAHFGNNLKITFYDDLNTNPRQFLKELCLWLEIDPAFFDSYNFEIENKTFAYKNRFIQKVAITANKNAARFWRQNPGIKRWMRKQYFKINRSKSEEIIDKNTLDSVSGLYGESNSKLKKFLHEKGFANLPSWLESS